MRLLVVGEAPSGVDTTARPELALTGTVGRRLARMAGCDWVAYLRRTERVNLFEVPVTKWDSRAARQRASEISLAGRTAVLLGARVAEAFGVSDWPLYDRRRLRGGVAVRVPHPSGRNRLLNDPMHRHRTGLVLAQELLSQ